MTLREKLQKAWENKDKIAEGFYNTFLSNDQEIKDEIAKRLSICSANTCGLWDPTGQSDRLAMKGYPGCMGCGCRGDMKTACMSCQCYLGDIDKATGEPHGTPLWTAVTTPEQDKELNEVMYRKQFDKK